MPTINIEVLNDEDNRREIELDMEVQYRTLNGGQVIHAKVVGIEVRAPAHGSEYIEVESCLEWREGDSVDAAIIHTTDAGGNRRWGYWSQVIIP